MQASSLLIVSALPLAAIISCATTNANESTTPSDPTPGNQMPTDQLLNPAGGTISYSQIKTSAYNNLFNSLNLFNDQVYLPNLTDTILNQKLHEKAELFNLNLAIQPDSNTAQGELFLSLKGNYENQVIDEAKIVLSGFQNYAFLDKTEFQFSQFKLNQQKWFDKQLPTATSPDAATKIESLSSQIWNEVLDDFSVSSAVSLTPILGQASQLKTVGFSFEIKGKYEQSGAVLTITTKFQNQKYLANNGWTNDGEKTWNQASFNKPFVPLPTEIDVIKFVGQQIQINQNLLKQHFPTYFLGRDFFFKKNSALNTFDELFSNSYLEDSNFSNYYFGANAMPKIAFVNGPVTADDWDNSLSFQAGLSLNGKQPTQPATFNFTNENKDLSQLDIFEKPNSVQIKTSSNWFNNIKSHLKTAHANEVNDLFNQGNKEITFNDFKLARVPEIVWKNPLPDFENQNNAQQQWDLLEQQIEPGLFGQPLIFVFNDSPDPLPGATLNFFSHLYWIDQNNAFALENFVYQLNSTNDPAANLEIKLIKDQRDLIQIQFTGQTNLFFPGGTSKTITTTFKTQLSRAEWTKTN